MKQAILVNPENILVKEVPVPEPAEGEVVIKIDTALTCGTDLKAYLRGHPFIPMPGPFGHEYTGTVAKTGKGVKKFREGDHVMGVHSAPCHECPYCKQRLFNLCISIMNNKVLGAFSEYLLLPSNIVKTNLFIKPHDVNSRQAALLEPLSCVVHPYTRLLNVTRQRCNMPEMNINNAIVMGAGPIGLMHVWYLKRCGVNVISSDFLDDRLSMASNLGADHTAIPEDLPELTNRITEDMGVDLVVECTGQAKAWETSINHVRRGGIVILFGGCPAGTMASYDTGRLHYDEVTLTGSFHYTPDDVKTAFELIKDSGSELSMLISGEFKLNDINKAFTLLEEGKGIKYAIIP